MARIGGQRVAAGSLAQVPQVHALDHDPLDVDPGIRMMATGSPGWVGGRGGRVVVVVGSGGSVAGVTGAVVGVAVVGTVVVACACSSWASKSSRRRDWARAS
ncbi:MAG: hypothetical protein M5U14_00425 [Acidimicrobiia bacterium]|nr:hypothetical protein [Acidimicrobiia bacterium]